MLLIVAEINGRKVNVDHARDRIEAECIAAEYSIIHNCRTYYHTLHGKQKTGIDGRKV